MHTDHDHQHDLANQSDFGAQKRALITALALTSVVTIAELVGGIVFSSLALMADAAHMFSDTVALAIALVAQQIASRPASRTHSFGWRRAEVLAAQVNGLLLLAACGWIFYEAIDRFSSPHQVDSTGVIAVATLGLITNLIATRLLHRVPGHSMNIRAAALHTASDAAGSLGAIVAGVAIALGTGSWIDPAASIFIGVLVFVAAIRLLIEATHVLLEAAPRHIDPEEIEKALEAEPAVVRVHHLHLWSLAPGSLALSAHVELEGIDALHDAQAEGDRLKQLLVDKFGVLHSTIELECHPCAPDDHH